MADRTDIEGFRKYILRQREELDRVLAALDFAVDACDRADQAEAARAEMTAFLSEHLERSVIDRSYIPEPLPTTQTGRWIYGSNGVVIRADLMDEAMRNMDRRIDKWKGIL
jgi:hypothetical protein